MNNEKSLKGIILNGITTADVAVENGGKQGKRLRLATTTTDGSNDGDDQHTVNVE